MQTDEPEVVTNGFSKGHGEHVESDGGHGPSNPNEHHDEVN
jgi:hypothetical protein